MDLEIRSSSLCLAIFDDDDDHHHWPTRRREMKQGAASVRPGQHHQRSARPGPRLMAEGNGKRCHDEDADRKPRSGPPARRHVATTKRRSGAAPPP